MDGRPWVNCSQATQPTCLNSITCGFRELTPTLILTSVYTHDSSQNGGTINEQIISSAWGRIKKNNFKDKKKVN